MGVTHMHALITMNAQEKAMVIPVTVTHHVQTTMVHTLANVIVVTPIPQLVSKLDLNVSLLLIAVLTMVVALMVAKFQLVVHAMKFAGLLMIHWLIRNVDQRMTKLQSHVAPLRWISNSAAV